MTKTARFQVTETAQDGEWEVIEMNILPVEVLVSQPYTKVAGGWFGMRSVGQRRTYTATVNGIFFTNENKKTFIANIRQYCHREELPRPAFTFKQSEC